MSVDESAVLIVLHVAEKRMLLCSGMLGWLGGRAEDTEL